MLVLAANAGAYLCFLRDILILLPRHTQGATWRTRMHRCGCQTAPARGSSSVLPALPARLPRGVAAWRRSTVAAAGPAAGPQQRQRQGAPPGSSSSPEEPAEAQQRPQEETASPSASSPARTLAGLGAGLAAWLAVAVPPSLASTFSEGHAALDEADPAMFSDSRLSFGAVLVLALALYWGAKAVEYLSGRGVGDGWGVGLGLGEGGGGCGANENGRRAGMGHGEVLANDLWVL